MIRVSPRARRHEDRAGDPLDGLVNLFDLGIVLSVGFLLAALSSLNLASDFADGDAQRGDTITVPQDAETGDVPADGEKVVGNGAEVGKVYRLDDGRLVYVVDPSAAASPLGSMSYFWEGLQGAWDLIWGRDPYLMGLLKVTLQVAGVATGVALVLGLPLGLVLALGRFPGRNAAIVLANAGLGLPPVVVGLILALLFLPAAPLGSLDLAFTLHGVYVAQSVLCLPIVVALTVSAVREISPGLLDQARAFGARRHRLAALALREARVGILAATIASVGAGLSEVGAVVLVGGNVVGASQTLASASLSATDAGRYSEGLAIGIILLGLIVVITGLLTWLQYGRVRYPRGWASS